MPEQLVVQIVAVSDDHDSGAVQVALQQVREEHHRKRLAGTLCVPEYADLSVACHCFFGAFDCPAHTEVLVVGSEDFHDLVVGVVETDEVPNEVEQACFRHHTVEHGLPGGCLGFGVIAVGRLPCNVSVFVGGDGPHARFRHIAHHAEDVRHEHAGDVVHVVA